ncbi:MAG: hypothetical protein RRB13_13855 [bacterium]|nr:hypothetical protein [bacterium]
MTVRLLIDRKPFMENKYRSRFGVNLDGQPLARCEALEGDGGRFRLMVGRNIDEVLHLPFDAFDPLIGRIYVGWDMPPMERVLLSSWSLDLDKSQFELLARFVALKELPQLRGDIQERLRQSFLEEPLQQGFFEENFFDDQAYVFYLPLKTHIDSTIRSWLPPLQAALAEAALGL